MKTHVAKQILLNHRPTGTPDSDTWKLAEKTLPPLQDSEFLVKNDYISVDPAMRGWIRDRSSYIEPVAIGEVMRALAVGTVIESRNANFPVGLVVEGRFGVTDYAISKGEMVRGIDTDIAPAPTWLGALGMPGLTAYFGLTEVGKVSPGDTLLVSAAAGAVGSIAGQIGKALGATVIGIAGGPRKCEWVKTTLGFDEAIDYKSPSFAKQLHAVAPNGVDVYFDNVGGPILEAALNNLALGARIVICGAIANYNAETPPPGPANYMSLLVKRASMTGFVVLDYEDRADEAIAQITDWMNEGVIHAADHVVEGGINAFPEALTQLFTGQNLGKVVLSVPN